MVLDGAWADEQLSGDLSVGVSLRDEAGDLRFLGSQVVTRVRSAFASALTSEPKCKGPVGEGAKRPR